MRFVVSFAIVGFVFTTPLVAFPEPAMELFREAQAYGRLGEDRVRDTAVEKYLAYLRADPDSPIKHIVYYRIALLYDGYFNSDKGEGRVLEKAWDYYQKTLDSVPEGMLDQHSLLAMGQMANCCPKHTREDSVEKLAEFWTLINELSGLSAEELQKKIPAFQDQRFEEYGFTCVSEEEALQIWFPIFVESSEVAAVERAAGAYPIEEAIRLLHRVEKLFAGSPAEKAATDKIREIRDAVMRDVTEQAISGILEEPEQDHGAHIPTENRALATANSGEPPALPDKPLFPDKEGHKGYSTRLMGTTIAVVLALALAITVLTALVRRRTTK